MGNPRGRPKKDRPQTTLARRLARAIKIKPLTAQKVIRELRDLIIDDLQKFGECSIPGFGKFTYKKEKVSGRHVTFRCTYNGKMLLRRLAYREKRISGTYLIERLSHDKKQREEAVRDNRFISILDYPNVDAGMARHFIYYLKNKFPLMAHWYNPNNKRWYTHMEVRDAIAIFQKLDPDCYVYMWSMWVSIEARRSLATEMRVNYDYIIKEWYLGVKGVLAILLYPDLVPAKFKADPVENPPSYTLPKGKKLNHYLQPFQKKKRR
jgi:hypothetical protein